MNKDNNVVIEVKDLCKTYVVNTETNNVLQNVSFSLERGEFLGVMGPSGSGKSTLLYTVSGMDNMTAGSVIFDGEDISALGAKQLSDLRLRKMGFIFQQMYMLKKLSIMDNIILPGYQAGQESRHDIDKRAEELMRSLGIIEYANRDITAVSGGELQRACLCRALINRPDVLFADEPTGALNSKAASGVMREFIKANQSGTSIMMVTHSPQVAAQCDRIIYIMDGNIQGEITLGKFTNESLIKERERKISNWLFEQGW